MDLQEVGLEVMDWIDLAQVRDRWRTPVNAVMNLRVPYNMGNFLTITSHEGPCSMELFILFKLIPLKYRGSSVNTVTYPRTIARVTVIQSPGGKKISHH